MAVNLEMNFVDSQIHIMDLIQTEKAGVSGPSVAAPIPSSTHWPSHHAAPGSSASAPRPRAPRHSSSRNEHGSWLLHQPLSFSFSFLAILVVWTCCLPLASASVYFEEEMLEPVSARPPAPSPARSPGKSQLLVDPSPPAHRPYNTKAWVLSGVDDDLKKRVNKRGDNDHTTSSTPASAAKSSTTSSSIAVATTEPTSPLPSPFDLGCSANLTDSCSSFLNGFLSNSTFISCLPFSLLLQTSAGFFQASKSIVRISQTLDATCSANLGICAPFMAALAKNLTLTANCASDFSAQNPQIIQAKLGLEAYQPLYTASCLRNPATSSYCFADAITNTQSPTDPYIYYLPLNASLPTQTRPTCNPCLKNTMAVFDAATSDRSSSIAGDYVAAAQLINTKCGSGFVNQSLSVEVKSAGLSNIAPPTSNVGLFALIIVVCSWFL